MKTRCPCPYPYSQPSPLVHQIQGGRGTDVDDDGDAVWQREVTAEFAFNHVEILTSTMEREGNYHWNGERFGRP